MRCLNISFQKTVEKNMTDPLDCIQGTLMFIGEIRCISQTEKVH